MTTTQTIVGTQRTLAYHFPLVPDAERDLVPASPQAQMVGDLAARYGDRLQCMTPEQAKIHAREAMEAGDWMALAAISMAMANI